MKKNRGKHIQKRTNFDENCIKDLGGIAEEEDLENIIYEKLFENYVFEFDQYQVFLNNVKAGIAKELIMISCVEELFTTKLSIVSPSWNIIQKSRVPKTCLSEIPCTFYMIVSKVL